jgi:hypothetical protein
VRRPAFAALSVAALSAFAFGLAAPSVQAETSVLARAGTWQAFGGTSSTARPVCGVAHTTADGSYFGVKLFAGGNNFTIQMGRKEWQIASQQKVKVEMRVDASRSWTPTASAMRFDDGGAGLEFALNLSEFDLFRLVFRNGAQLRLQFEAMPEWVIDLTGSNAIGDALQDCVRGLR